MKATDVYMKTVTDASSLLAYSYFHLEQGKVDMNLRRYLVYLAPLSPGSARTTSCVNGVAN